jgi:asparagine synthase (glutamine-hydrolysing)
MCGVAGFWTRGGWVRDGDETLRSMTDLLRHRGPDDAGHWADPAAGVWLGHRRLAILDLSPDGHQPMRSPSGRYHIVYNGEIYNFQDLRATLERDGATFRSSSDTEVMLAAFERWGLRRAVERFDGMFAFALWDAAERTLFLARDRLGEKPLYYAAVGRSFLFGSELKALRVHPEWRGAGGIDRGALALYIRHSYIPAPYTIHSDVRKLLPGTILAVRSTSAGFETAASTYWSARTAVRQGLAEPLQRSEAEVVDACESLLRGVIGRQMIADVPLGAFLSGGIDSSTVVALMQVQSRRPVRTFTIGFPEREYNEAQHAKAVAAHLGTDHTELYVTPSDLLGVIPELPILYDEPFADSSQIPTLLVSRLTRAHVTVSLSGDGGDELFGGYTRYPRGRLVGRLRDLMPAGLRRTLAAGLRRVPGRSDRSERLQQLARLLGAETAQEMYRHVVSQDSEPGRLVLGATEPETLLAGAHGLAREASFVHHMMHLDLVSYLPDDILVKVDRASMAASLESRAPFLDHHVVEFAWRVPLALKFRNGKGKWLLRQVLHRHVPADLVERPKRGFGVPLGAWLRGPLRDWAGDLLQPERLTADGYFDPAAIAALWDRQQGGSRRCDERLWTVLMFQAWLRAQERGRVGGSPALQCVGPGREGARGE